MKDEYLDTIDLADTIEELDDVKLEIQTEYELCADILSDVATQSPEERSRYNIENKGTVDLMRNYNTYMSAIEIKKTIIDLEEEGELEPLSADEFDTLLEQFKK